MATFLPVTLSSALLYKQTTPHKEYACRHSMNNMMARNETDAMLVQWSPAYITYATAP